MRLHTIPLTSHVHFKQCRFYSVVLLKIQHACACVHVGITSLNKWHFARTAIDSLLTGTQSIMRYSLRKGELPPENVIVSSLMPNTSEKNKETHYIFSQNPMQGFLLVFQIVQLNC